MKDSISFMWNCLFCVDITDSVGQIVLSQLLRLKFIFHIEDYFIVELQISEQDYMNYVLPFLGKEQNIVGRSLRAGVP